MLPFSRTPLNHYSLKIPLNLPIVSQPVIARIDSNRELDVAPNVCIKPVILINLVCHKNERLVT